VIEILEILFLYAIVFSFFPWHEASVLVCIPAWCVFWRTIPVLDLDVRSSATDIAADFLSYPIILGYPVLCLWTGYHRFDSLFGLLPGLILAVCVQALGLLFPRRWTKLQ